MAEDKVRIGLIARTILEVLGDAGGPMRRRDVLDELPKRVEFSDYERAMNKNGEVRWFTVANLVSGLMSKDAWIAKGVQGWSLQARGKEILAATPTADFEVRTEKLARDMRRQSAQKLREQESSAEDAVRHGLIQTTLLGVMLEHAEPVHYKTLVAEVAARISLNRAELAEDSRGRLAYVMAARWDTVPLVHIGWMRKLDGPWVLTDAGREAIEFYGLENAFDIGVGLDRDEIRSRDRKVDTDEGDAGGDALSAKDASSVEALAERISMPAEAISELLDLIYARRQVVLYGPPGTGKTYLAQELAHHMTTGEESAYMMVQFHPSYAYEDFFEGLRPDVVDGAATFTLQPGPLLRIARSAAENPDTAHVLVIDEINRANIAKVFGELYFLLEYRKASIALQYGDKRDFTVPQNLYLIATMNTVDRSIALVDAAIRRRFAFVELHPSEEPVLGVLERSGRASQAALLAELNRAIGADRRDLHIGPSYLMRAEADTDAGRERIWKYDILPLLEEQFYDQLGRDEIRERFGYDAIKAAAGLS